MKRFSLFLLITLLGFFSGIISISANDADKKNTILIESYEEDVTGDGKKEEIKLKGVRFSEDSQYFHSVWADIEGQQNKQWKIVYEGGYDPSLKFKDLNHDGVNDVLFQSSTNDTQKKHNYTFHYLKDNKLKELKVPESFTITGEFKRDFKASLHLDPSKNPKIIDLKHRADDYIHDGIYNDNGELLKDTHLLVDSITTMKPVYINKNKGYGLKSFQPVSGTTHQDVLGTIEAFWYFEDGKWIKLKQNWNPYQS